MYQGCFILLVAFIALTSANRLASRKTLADYLDTCMLGKVHKERPGPEGQLYNQCTPWKYRSCCRGNTSMSLHTNQTWYKFDWNHCGKLSEKCKKHFVQDLCFYECSPNVGPWLVEERRAWRSERYLNVPLCSSQCTNWWNDCKDEMTCVDNWAASGNFNFSSGKNTCPNNKPCGKFHQVFGNAVKFCEQIWDHSWKVVDDKKEPCFKIWFTPESYPKDKNPNYQVAKNKAASLIMHITSGSSYKNHSSFVSISIFSFIFYLV